MKFIVLKENINRVLPIISRNISPRTQLPILSNILLKTENGQLKIATTNLELSIIFKIQAKIEKEGETTIPGKLLSEFISNLTGDKIEFSLEDKKLSVRTNKTHATFATMTASDFPPFPDISKPSSVFPFSKIKEVISRIVFAASTDESRPVLTGVKTVINNGKITLSATDGYRLSFENLRVSASDNLNIILPADSLSEIIRISQEIKTDEVGFSIIENKNQAVFTLGNSVIYTRLIDGEFPNIEKIIPSNFKTKVVIDKERFMQAVKTTSLFARGAANIIKIKIEKDGMRLSANTPQVGEDEDFLEAKVEGEEIEAAFNYRFLLDLLSNFPEENVVFETSGSLNPGVFKSEKNDSSFLHIIMPVRVQG